MPDTWTAGRIWVRPWFSVIIGQLLTVLNPKGRRDCDFSNNPGPNSCLDGGCNGGLECDKSTGMVSNSFDLLASLGKLTFPRVFPRLPLANLP